MMVNCEPSLARRAGVVAVAWLLPWAGWAFTAESPNGSERAAAKVASPDLASENKSSV